MSYIYYAQQFPNIQAAVDACDSGGGGTVQLPQGVTEIDVAAMGGVGVRLPVTQNDVSPSRGYATVKLKGAGPSPPVRDRTPRTGAPDAGTTLYFRNATDGIGIQSEGGKFLDVSDMTLEVEPEAPGFRTIAVGTEENDRPAALFSLRRLHIVGHREQPGSVGVWIPGRSQKGVLDNVRIWDFEYGVQTVRNQGGEKEAHGAMVEIRGGSQIYSNRVGIFADGSRGFGMRNIILNSATVEGNQIGVILADTTQLQCSHAHLENALIAVHVTGIGGCIEAFATRFGGRGVSLQLDADYPGRDDKLFACQVKKGIRGHGTVYAVACEIRGAIDPGVSVYGPQWDRL